MTDYKNILCKNERDIFWGEIDNENSFNGHLHKTMKYIEEIQLKDPVLWRRFVQQFREYGDNDGRWRGEFWGKMMRGACFVYSYTKDKELYEMLTTTVVDMLESADADGRISSYDREHEADCWDLWCRKYVLLGMQYFLEICDDEKLCSRIVESMCLQLDCIMEVIGDEKEGKRNITKSARNWRGLSSSSILEPVVRLYNLTKKQKYFDFATYIVECGGIDVDDIFKLAYEDELRPYQYPVTKAYEMTSCFEGLLEYYHITGTEWYKTAIVNFANRILEHDFTIIGGSGCTLELFDNSKVRQANTTNGKVMQETCVTVTLMKFFYHLLQLTGDSKFADAFEISLYNAYLGSVNTEKCIDPTAEIDCPGYVKEPMPFDSYSPLTAGTRGNGVGGIRGMSDNHYYGCCACIGSAGIGLVLKMTLMSKDNGFVYNLFVDGKITTKTVSGCNVTFTTTTNYPKDGYVKITVDTEKETEFELLIRNPRWSKNTGLSVNGESIAISENYISINRMWKNGDVIEVYLDMRTKAIYPIAYGSQVLMNRVVWGHNYVGPRFDKEDPIAKHHIALRRGPIVLAQENRLGYSVDDPVTIKVDSDGFVDAKIPEKDIAPYEHIVEVRVPLENGTEMTLTDYSSAGKLWNEESKMAAWILTE